MYSIPYPEVLMCLMFFALAMAVAAGDCAVLVFVVLFFVYLYLSDSAATSAAQAAWKKAQALSAKLFAFPVENLLLALAAIAVFVAALRLFAWVFAAFAEAGERRKYRQRWEEYQENYYWDSQRDYHQERRREEPQDDYSVLGLTRGATLAEIKAAYRRLAKKYHPDAGGDPEAFMRIHAAYQNLVAGR